MIENILKSLKDWKNRDCTTKVKSILKILNHTMHNPITTRNNIAAVDDAMGADILLFCFALFIVESNLA